jgi:hypothetical protein
MDLECSRRNDQGCSGGPDKQLEFSSMFWWHVECSRMSSTRASYGNIRELSGTEGTHLEAEDNPSGDNVE